MAYTVGSASVEIVPDFRNAQIAITAFFAKQSEEMRVPVRLLIDKDSTRNVEKDADQLGTKVGKAMSDGMAKSQGAADREAIKQAKARERAILQAHAEAHKENDRLNREAERATKAHLDAETKARIQAERDAVRLAQGEQQAFERAHTEALRINAQMDRDRARSAQQALREAQRLAEERIRIDAEAERIMARTRQQVAREEENFARKSGAAIQRAFNTGAKEYARQEKLRLTTDDDDARRGGRRVGGLIVNAAREEIRQNAGLISAVLAGALIAGAPAFLGAATTLFAGVGAVAAFQSDQLRRTWTGLWNEIKSSAVSDASILVPAYSRMAGAIGRSFQQMRPLIRDAFTAVSPQIDTFSNSLVRTAQNVLPGLVRAVQSAGPVIDGLGRMFEKTGVGLSNFFTVLSTHSAAAGAAASGLGDALGALLPTLAELLGQGAETASVVLPLLTSALRSLDTVVGALGFSMPALTTAFLGFRAVRGIGRIVDGWSDSLGKAAEKGGMFSGVMSKTSGVMATATRAVPLVAGAVAILSAGMAIGEQRIQNWTQALNEGGKAAAQARQEMSSKSWIDQGIFATDSFAWLREIGGAFGIGEKAAKSARDANEAYIKSLSPLEAAQRNVSIASKELDRLLSDESSTSADLEGAKRALGRATAAQAREEENLQRATEGVTQAMQDQADAARARVDSSFAYQQSVQDVAEAQQKLKETLADTKASTIDVSKATLDYNQSLERQAVAAGELAKSNLPASMSDQQKAIIGASASLAELNKMMASGVKLPPELEQYRQKLIQITGGADTATLEQAQLSAALQEVGASVESIPNSKSIEITDPSPAIIERLRDLGFTIVNLPNGKVRVTPETDKAKGALGDLSTLLTNLSGTTATPKATLNDSRFKNTHKISMQALNQLNNQHPSPTVSIKDKATGPTRTAISLVDLFGGKSKTATIGVRDQASGTLRSIIGNLASIVSKTVTVTVHNRLTTPGMAATGGAVEDVISGRNRSRFLPRYDGGGATFGIGGPLDDLNTIRVSPGEHVLDAHDVGLLGGQAGVYAFREMLNSGKFGSFSSGTGVRQMVAAGETGRAPSGVEAAPRVVQIHTSDNPRAIVRAMRAEEHQTAALASRWP